MIDVGDKAPEFTLPASDGEQVSLRDFKDQTVVLYFYPRADTGGCTKQAIGFTEAKGALDKAGTVVIGVSKDPVKKLAKFKEKRELDVILVSDEESDLCEQFGVWVEKSMYGKTYMGIERSTFVIEGGSVTQAWRKVKVPGHVDAVLEAVGA